MSGWLGTINYGVITASKVDSFLSEGRAASAPPTAQSVAG
jgi:hypothetical protein